MLKQLNLLVIFASTISVVFAHFQKIELQPGGDVVTIETPNYPKNAEDVSLHYVLLSPYGSRIAMKCDDMKLQKREPCSSRDLFYVFGRRIMDNLCGDQSGYTTESINNDLTLKITIGYGGGRVSCKAWAFKPKNVNPDEYLTPGSSESNSVEAGGIGQVSLTCPCGWTNKARIVGGKEANINEFPLIAGIIKRHNKFLFCGGTILTPYHVLTAAHCTHPLKGVTQLAVVVGEHDETKTDESAYTEIINVDEVIEHEMYNPVGFKYDIALLVLERKITYSQFVGPACLPTGRMNLLNEQVKVIGWGRTKDGGDTSDVLRHVNLKVVPIEICSQRMASPVPTNQTRQICTFGFRKDSCEGDSGGPLIWLDPQTNRYTLVALVSFGKQCGKEDPGVNTDVSFYLDWIHKQIQKTKPGQKTCSKAVM